MDDPAQVVKDDWNTILGELDGIVRETHHLSLMAIGDKDAFEGENFPALIHFISEIKKEKKNQSWEKIEHFANSAKENLKFLDETQQIKMQNRRIDRSFIGTLPKNTDQIGSSTIEILNEIPIVLRTINESVEAMLIDIKLKLDFSIVKFEKEIIDIKHQIALLEDQITSHTNTVKKGLVSREEQIIYTQAYRETYYEILEKAASYIIRDFSVHSKAFEDVYERYLMKIKNYKESPAFDDFIKENCSEIEKSINTWLVDGFKAFIQALKFVRKIDDRLSDTKQSHIQQIKSDLEAQITDIVTNIVNLLKLEAVLDTDKVKIMKEASEKVISAARFFARTVDVVAVNPHEKLIYDEKILRETTNMLTAAFEGTYGKIEQSLDEFIKQIPPSKSTKKYLDIIKETKENCLGPNNLDDGIKSIPALIEFKNNIDVLLKEIARDVVDTQEKFIKKIKNINKYIGQTDAIPVPSEDELVKVEKIDLNDSRTLSKVVDLLKESLVETATSISSFEEKISDGLGIIVNPDLESKLSRYKRPSYNPTVKQANSAMNELEGFAKDLTKDTGEAITNYIKDLKKFIVKSPALITFLNLLKIIGKEASTGKITLTQITVRLEQAVEEYAKLLETIITDNSEEIALIMKDMSKVEIYKDMTLDDFSLKHDELVNNIALDSVAQQKEKTTPELLCKICNGKIVWKEQSYNDMLGLDVLKVRCENSHEDNIIGFASNEEEVEDGTIELKCSKCDSETLIPSKIDLYSKDKLIVTATCPKNHDTEFNIKKK
ncbi:MAG TPA: hypothetical protein VMZ29_00165 [Candidatus Bathyarchaeia archaeon]|nr:hypothetical protein [Candidatus Bathyarchaeia archaeon]